MCVCVTRARRGTDHYEEGDHANAGRVPLSKTGGEGARPASARPSSAGGGTKKKRIVRKKKAREPPPPWGAAARPKTAAERRSVLSPSAKANAAADGAAQEKALVDQLTRALSTLEARERGGSRPFTFAFTLLFKLPALPP